MVEEKDTGVTPLYLLRIEGCLLMVNGALNTGMEKKKVFHKSLSNHSSTKKIKQIFKRTLGKSVKLYRMIKLPTDRRTEIQLSRQEKILSARFPKYCMYFQIVMMPNSKFVNPVRTLHLLVLRQ